MPASGQISFSKSLHSGGDDERLKEKFKTEEQRTGKPGRRGGYVQCATPVLSSSALSRMSVDECLVVEACPWRAPLRSHLFCMFASRGFRAPESVVTQRGIPCMPLCCDRKTERKRRCVFIMSPGRFLALQEVWRREPSLFRYLLCFTPSVLLTASRLSPFSFAFFLKRFYLFFLCEEKTDGKFLR